MTYSDGRAERTFGRRGLPAQTETRAKKGFGSVRVPTIADIPPALPDDESDAGAYGGLGSGIAAGAVTPALVALYIGPNSDKYLATYANMQAKDPGLGKIAAGWCWPMFLVPLPWLLYRKQWGLLVAFVILPILIAYFFPTANAASFGVAVVFAVFAKSIYLKSGIAKIRAIIANETDPDLVTIRIMQAGGVSVPGAVIGAIIMIAGGVVTVLATLAAVAPA